MGSPYIETLYIFAIIYFSPVQNGTHKGSSRWPGTSGHMSANEAYLMIMAFVFFLFIYIYLSGLPSWPWALGFVLAIIFIAPLGRLPLVAIASNSR